MTEDSDELLVLALRAEEAGDLIGAVSNLEEFVRRVPGNAKTRTWLGRLYANREQYAAAVDMLESAIAIDSSQARSHAALAEVLIELERWAEAEIAIRRSIEINPTSSSVVILGYVLSSQDKAGEAQLMFAQALELDHDNEEAMYNLALELRTVDPTRARDLFDQAVKIDPLYADAHREYGFQLAQAYDFIRAEHELLTALSLQSSDSLSHVYLANVLASTGRVSAAESHLVTACDLSPLSALPRWGLGKLRELQGRTSDAERLYREAVSVQPMNAEAMFQLSRFLVATGRRGEAAELLKRVLSLAPWHEEARKLQASGAT